MLSPESSIRERPLSWSERMFAENVALILGVKTLNEVSSSRIYKGEIDPEEYKEKSKNKKYQKLETKLKFSESMQEVFGIDSVSLIDLDKRYFDSKKQVGASIFKVKFHNGAVKYLVIDDRSKTALKSNIIRMGAESSSVEIKRSRDKTSALGDKYWSTNWRREKVDESYKTIDKTIWVTIKKLVKERKGLSILEVCGGNGELASLILSKTKGQFAEFTMLEYNKASCEKAEEKLKEFGIAKVVQTNVLTGKFEGLFEKPPSIVIASGALTTMVFNNPEECEVVLKKIIKIMPEDGLLILTGLMPQQVSLPRLLQLAPFKVLNSYKYVVGGEFIVLEREPFSLKPKIQKDGTVDLFQCFQLKDESPKRLREVLETFSEEDLKKIKRLDLSALSIHPGELEALAMLPNLKSLKLAHTENCNELLKRLPVDHLTHLKHLDLSYTDVKESRVKKILKKLNIQSLKLELCPNLSLDFQMKQTLVAAARGKKMDLSFLRNNCYSKTTEENLPEILKFIESLMPKSKTVIITSELFNKSKKHKKELKDFLKGKDVEVIIDIPLIPSQKEDLDNEAAILNNIFDKLELEEKRTEDFIFNFPDLDKKEKKLCLAIFRIGSKNNIEKGTGLKPKEIYALVKYVESKKEAWLEKAHNEGKTLHIGKNESGMPRTIEITPEGEIFILLKSKMMDPVGAGKRKVIKFSLQYPLNKKAPELVSGFTVQGDKSEVLSRLKGSQSPHIMPILSMSSYVSDKTGGSKLQIISPYYSKGTLEDRLPYVTLISELLQGLKEFHKLGLVHGDIHGGNIFVDDDLRYRIGDFDEASLIGEPMSGGLNVYRMPPEVLMALIDGNEVIADPKIDVWMAGLELARSYRFKIPFMKEIEAIEMKETPDSADLEKILKLMQTPIPKPKNAIQRVIWKMIQVNPEDRISLNEAIAEVNNIMQKKKVKAISKLSSKPAKQKYISSNEQAKLQRLKEIASRV